MRVTRVFFAVLFTSVLLAAPVWATSEEPSGDAHAEEDSGHHSGSLNWIDFTDKHSPPIVALFVNFVLLVVIVYFVLRKSLSARFRNRRDELEKAIEEARESKAKAEKAIEAARARVAAIDAELASLKSSILEAGQAQSSRIVHDAEQHSKRLKDDARAMVEHEIAQMAEEIRRQITDEVVAKAEQMVAQKIGANDHDRLTREYLSGISSLKEG